jgi:hypothetical protein
MITSKQIITLSEEWETSFTYGNHLIDIFVNPTSSDIKELFSKLDVKINPKKEIRFIANAKTKKVYIWDASLVHHAEVSHKLGFSHPGEYDGLITSEPPYIFDGFGYLSSGKIVGQNENGSISDIKIALNAKLISKGKKSKQNYWFIEEWISRFNAIFYWDWSFIDRYVPGFSRNILTLKEQFLNWMKT